MIGVKAAVKRGIGRGALRVAARAGVFRLLGRRYGGVGVIYALHRVEADGQPLVYPGYRVTVGQLERLLVAVRALGHEIVSIDEVARRLDASSFTRPFCCFTFDDGYADNLTVALPVFRRHGAPLAVYLNTALLERDMFYWWGALEELVLGADEVEVPATPFGPARTLPARTEAEKQAAFEVLDALGHRLGDRVLPALEPLLARHGVDPARALDRDALTMAQARELARDPLVTIGSHAMSHRRLSSMPEATAIAELVESKRRLEASLSVAVDHLAYPFGGRDACGAREFAIARAAGYRTAVTLRRGNVFAAHAAHRHALPRRVVPLDELGIRSTLFGVESLLRRQAPFQTD